MKHRIKYIDSSWLFFTPFAFLNMGGTGTWVIQAKRHWWNRWETVEKFDDKTDAFISYFKKRYNWNVRKYRKFPHNRDKDKTVKCKLVLKYNSYSKEYAYVAGYKPENYAEFYYCCYSSESYEDALYKLCFDLEVRNLYWRRLWGFH